MQHILNIYFTELSLLKLPMPGEEAELIDRIIISKDKEAIQRLIESNLRFVVSVAKNYQHQGLSLPELISEGNLGLIQAARGKYTPRDYKFISYTYKRIKGSILDAISAQAKKTMTTVSGDELIFEGGRSLFESLEMFYKSNDDYLEETVKFVFNNLKPKEAEIFKKFHGIDYDCSYTFKEIADEWGVSRQYIHEIYTKAKTKLNAIHENKRKVQITELD